MYVSAKLVPRFHVASITTGYVLGIIAYYMSSKSYVFSISQLGANYPSRPLIQVGFALSTLLQIATIMLWYVKTSSKRLVILGIGRFITSLASAYVTAEDSPFSGTMAIAASAFTGLWMLYLSFVHHHNLQAVSVRRYLAIGYAACVVLSIHYLGVYLEQGYGQKRFVFFRFIALFIDIYFTSLAVEDFDGILFKVQANGHDFDNIGFSHEMSKKHEGGIRETV